MNNGHKFLFSTFLLGIVLIGAGVGFREVSWVVAGWAIMWFANEAGRGST